MTAEQWRPVRDWNGLYEVSDLGRVRSIDRTVAHCDGRRRALKGRVLQPHTITYPMVSLTRNDQKTSCQVHKLVALAFLGPCPAGQEVRHLDGDPANCTLANLAYGTHGENTRDKRRHGTDHNVNKARCPQDHPYDEANTYVLPSRPGARYCKACRRQRATDRRARRGVVPRVFRQPRTSRARNTSR